MSYENLEAWGWDAHFHSLFDSLNAPHLFPARITFASRGRYRLATPQGPGQAVMAGALQHQSQAADWPAVGDWVAVRGSAGSDALVEAVLPRRTAFTRKKAGEVTEAQVAAANVDAVFLVCGLDGDFNLSRIERYLAVAWESGANPVVVLNKADIAPALADQQGAAESVAAGCPVLLVSALEGRGVDALNAHLAPGKTAALLGSSGAGKSTLLNQLLGKSHMATGAVREDDQRGRHTTTHRELVRMPNGALLIDTPGMRELGLWDGGALEQGFSDVESLAALCRFRDCEHEAEPGCAVREAIASGELEERRLASYRKLQREAEFVERKRSEKGEHEQRTRNKEFAKMVKRISREKRRF